MRMIRDGLWGTSNLTKQLAFSGGVCNPHPFSPRGWPASQDTYIITICMVRNEQSRVPRERALSGVSSIEVRIVSYRYFEPVFSRCSSFLWSPQECCPPPGSPAARASVTKSPFHRPHLNFLVSSVGPYDLSSSH